MSSRVVLPGQYLERHTLVPLASGEVLEAIAHRGTRLPPFLIVPPTPSEGGSMDHVVAAEVAYAAAVAGHQTLRFNFRGVGASQGTISSSEEQLDDLRAAWELIFDNAGGSIPLVVSLRGSEPLVQRLIKRPGIAGWALIHPTVRPFCPSVPHIVFAPELDASFDRRGWSQQAGAEVAIIAGADRTFQRNLPQIGRMVVELAGRVGT